MSGTACPRFGPAGLLSLGLLGGGLLGCVVEDVVARRTAPSPADAGGGSDALPPAISLGCDATEPLIPLLDGTCGSPERYTLCVCGDATGSDAWQVSGPASIRGRWSVGGADVAGRLDVGSLVGLGGNTVSAAALVAAGAVQVNGSVEVTGRLMAGGDIQTSFLRAASVWAPPGATVQGTSLPVNRSLDQVEPTPCDCGLELGPDGLDAAGRTLATDPSTRDLESTAGTLPCGAWRVRRWAGTDVNLRVEGRAQVVVTQGVNAENRFRIETPAESRLDLVVAGGFVSSVPLELGGDGELNLRILGGGTVQLSGGGFVSGDLDAPGAELVVGGPLTVGGRLRAAALSASAPIWVQGQAAPAETGGPCETELDCCGPEICRDQCSG